MVLAIMSQSRLSKASKHTKTLELHNERESNWEFCLLLSGR